MAEIGIGMLGYAFMGKAHSNAFRKLAYLAWPPPLVPRLVAIAGRNQEAVADAASRYGYQRWTTDWRDTAPDEQVGLLDNGGPNHLHAEPTIAAAQAGKHVLCEKPLARSAEEAGTMLDATGGVVATTSPTSRPRSTCTGGSSPRARSPTSRTCAASSPTASAPRRS